MNSAGQRVIACSAEWRPFARELAAAWQDCEILLLSGPMGAGKTELVRALIEELGGRGVSSPTYSLHQVYETSVGEVNHFDLFRLTSEAELDGIGFWEVLDQAKGRVIVEWADRLGDRVWPATWNRTEVTIGILPSGRSLSWIKK